MKANIEFIFFFKFKLKITKSRLFCDVHILHINYHCYIATEVLHALSTKFSKATIVTRERVH